VSVKQATKTDELAGAEHARAIEIRPINRARVISLLETTGDPRQVVLEDHLDPVEVLGNEIYWKALPADWLPPGARIEVTNDAGTYLLEAWVRSSFGSASTGIRGIRFFHRIVWDERAEAAAAEIAATGNWDVRYDGRFHRWRVYRPNGLPIELSFNTEGAALTYMREVSRNSSRM
jgi:hypothetical protein